MAGCARVEQTINECSVLIVILSPFLADRDSWIDDEIAVAQKLEKPIFRLLLGSKVFWFSRFAIFKD